LLNANSTIFSYIMVITS